MNDKAALVWMRCNPPTQGHGLLIKKLDELASQGYDVYAFTTHTEITPGERKKAAKSSDPSEQAQILRNPLSWEEKVYFLQKLYADKYPEVTIVTNPNIRVIAEAFNTLKDDYASLSLVAGSDRIPEYEEFLKRYETAEHPDAELNVISAGERDPDAEGITGISATKLRTFVLRDDYESFKMGIDTEDESTIKELYDALKQKLKV